MKVSSEKYSSFRDISGNQHCSGFTPGFSGFCLARRYGGIVELEGAKVADRTSSGCDIGQNSPDRETEAGTETRDGIPETRIFSLQS